MSKKTKILSIIIIPLGVIALICVILFAFVLPKIKDNKEVTLAEEDYIADDTDGALKPIANESDMASVISKKIDYSEWREKLHQEIIDEYSDDYIVDFNTREIDACLDLMEKYGIEMSTDKSHTVIPVNLSYYVSHSDDEELKADYDKLLGPINDEWDAYEYEQSLTREDGGEDEEYRAQQEWLATQHEEFILRPTVNGQQAFYDTFTKKLEFGQDDICYPEWERVIKEKYPSSLGTFNEYYIPDSLCQVNEAIMWEEAILGLNDGKDVQFRFVYIDALNYCEIQIVNEDAQIHWEEKEAAYNEWVEEWMATWS